MIFKTIGMSFESKQGGLMKKARLLRCARGDGRYHSLGTAPNALKFDTPLLGRLTQLYASMV